MLCFSGIIERKVIRESKLKFPVEIFFKERSKKKNVSEKKCEWMKDSDSKRIDNPQKSGHQHSDVKVEHLYICGKSLASLWRVHSRVFRSRHPAFFSC